jgi:replicative DNA helicase
MPTVPPNIQLPPTILFRPLDLGEVIADFDFDLRTGKLACYRPTPLGFPLIDQALGGGLRAEDLVLVGGMQNVGKTIFALQVARNLAAAGEVLPIVVCYEHSPRVLLHRLLCLESAIDTEGEAGGTTRSEIETAILAYYDQVPSPQVREALGLQWLLENVPGMDRAWRRIRRYLPRLWLVRGDGLDTTDDKLAEYVRMAQQLGFQRVVLIVDYAQRVPLRPRLNGIHLDELQRIDLVMRGLKGIAQQFNIPVLAVAAADADGLRRQRIHFEDLWGDSVTQYEPDTALILNRDTVDAAQGVRTVRLAIEKNRNGPSEVEFRHQLHGKYFYLSPVGEPVNAEESYQAERVELRLQKKAAPDAALTAMLGHLLERLTPSPAEVHIGAGGGA